MPALRDAGPAAARGSAEPGPPRPIHGAPHPPQWLVDGDALGLIDFDRLALGDPEADVAAFMEAAAAEDDGEPVAAAFARGYGALDRAGWTTTGASAASRRRCGRHPRCALTATNERRAGCG